MKISEFKQKCKEYEFQEIESKGVVESFNGGEIELVGYKWQEKVEFFNDLDIIWNYALEQLIWDDINEQCEAYVYLSFELEDGHVSYNGYGVSRYKTRSGKLDKSLTGKTAEDDAFGRAAVKTGLGMKAYRGQETRSPKKFPKVINSYLEELDKVRNYKKFGIASTEQLQTFLIKYGFELTQLPLLDGVKTKIEDQEYDSLDVASFTEEHAKLIYDFISDNHPVKLTGDMVKIIKSKKGYKDDKAIWGMFRKLVNSYGKRAVEMAETVPDSIKPTAKNWYAFLESKLQEKYNVEDANIG